MAFPEGPLPSVDLGHRGVVILGHPSNHDHPHPEDEPVWAEAAALGIPVHVHVRLASRATRPKPRASRAATSPGSRRSAVRNRQAIGVENMMWTSDFPHHGCEWPPSWKVVDAEFRDVANAERRQILAGNAARLYGLTHLAPAAQSA